MTTREATAALRVLRAASAAWDVPSVSFVAENSGSPFQILIATVLSLRTQDSTTIHAARRLFALASDPRAMLALDEATIAKAIYPVGFYRQKAGQIREICRILLERYGGEVPRDLDALLELPGVGRKTANLVVSLGYGLPGICVDTHVHRITNRWGYVETRTPEETEKALRAKLPRPYWIEINRLLVQFGQGICRPISPRCSTCPVARWCRRVGVTRAR
ncbi:MAG TPA: endonuclease III [Thermodesulfobacteriota bacterium]